MTEEDSEKRFHLVMDKLFNSPKSNSISRNQSPRGQKRGSSTLSGSNGESNDSGGSIIPMSRSLVPARSLSLSSSEAPLCRPWDRGDLMRRLATFKSMTWFGKPKVVSAVNCARRGWINVESDIITCEACGARLLFLNPSSWTRQQVEKAAAVFSLKLDNGHKLLCPWIDNACDESLAQFPPTPAPALIVGYKERCSALLQLSALPIISSSAIDYMRCPQLECFLESSVEFGIGSVDTSRIDYMDHESAPPADLYYQAQKLISVCGWEPRSLLQSDPASVVLDCKLCGASAGLWAFSTVPRPLEWFRVVETVEVNAQNGVTMETPTSTKERSLSLNLSIAGGLPPEKQNYRATISLPIISRHLRADVSRNDNNDDTSSEGCFGIEQGVDKCASFSVPVKDLKRVQLDQAMEFDPIRQHRHFCPWIVSTGKTVPGWQLTLSALDREQTPSRPAPPDSPSSSMFEVDDPITSVRNLFKSPGTKRLKTSCDSR